MLENDVSRPSINSTAEKVIQIALDSHSDRKELPDTGSVDHIHVSGVGATTALAGQSTYFDVTTVDYWNNPSILFVDGNGIIDPTVNTDPVSLCASFSIAFYYGSATIDNNPTSPDSINPTGNLGECLVTYSLSTAGLYQNGIQNNNGGAAVLLNLTVSPGAFQRFTQVLMALKVSRNVILFRFLNTKQEV